MLLQAVLCAALVDVALSAAWRGMYLSTPQDTAFANPYAYGVSGCPAGTSAFSLGNHVLSVGAPVTYVCIDTSADSLVQPHFGGVYVTNKTTDGFVRCVTGNPVAGNNCECQPGADYDLVGFNASASGFSLADGIDVVNFCVGRVAGGGFGGIYVRLGTSSVYTASECLVPNPVTGKCNCDDGYSNRTTLIGDYFTSNWDHYDSVSICQADCGKMAGANPRNDTCAAAAPYCLYCGADGTSTCVPVTTDTKTGGKTQCCVNPAQDKWRVCEANEGVCAHGRTPTSEPKCACLGTTCPYSNTAPGVHTHYCCPPGEQCLGNGKCCKSGACFLNTSNPTCCAEGSKCIDDQLCCPKGEMACKRSDGSLGECCNDQANCNNGVCCSSPGQQGCSSGDFCCDKGQTCCYGSNGQQSCCPGDNVCCDGSFSTTCCPTSNTTCCYWYDPDNPNHHWGMCCKTGTNCGCANEEGPRVKARALAANPRLMEQAEQRRNARLWAGFWWSLAADFNNGGEAAQLRRLGLRNP